MIHKVPLKNKHFKFVLKSLSTMECVRETLYASAMSAMNVRRSEVKQFGNRCSCAMSMMASP